MKSPVWTPATGSLDLSTLSAGYADGSLTPSMVVAAIYDRIEKRGNDSVWIHLVPREQALHAAKALEQAGPTGQPLWGIPFSVKDCNDIAGLPTTNALPEQSYVADHTGQALQRLFDQGAILIGKTNMDQFGIGLVGVRTPYGACSSVFNEEFISGGSSSGSGVAVAAGLCTFSVGNDAAGSGRVPAAFNNIVGIKPTPGLISNSCVSGGGCVKTIETVSVFSLTVEDGMTVLKQMAGYDASYPFSKAEADEVPLDIVAAPASFRFGIPKGPALQFFGDADAERLFSEAVKRMEQMGGTAVEIDFAAFDEVQRILYDGPWISERALSLDPVLAKHGDRIHPVTKAILERSGKFSALDTFRAIHRIAELKCATRPVWDDIAVLMVPTTPTIYRKSEVLDDPIALNSKLGIYTNFVNLMGLCGIAVPGGFRTDGLPLGVTFLAPGFAEARVAGIAATFHRLTGLPLGASQNAYPPARDQHVATSADRREIVVVGAHLSGMPLNGELTSRGGKLVRTGRTARDYQLFALAGTTPAKPGLIRRHGTTGPGIEIEVWSLPTAGFGDFVSSIPSPLCVGKVSLDDGSSISGFLCEPSALETARDVTQFGGWKNFLRASA
jgi:allophanate hydrolase